MMGITGGSVSAGGVVSVTVIVNARVPVFPCESVELQVTDVVPTGDITPSAGRQVTDPATSSGSCATTSSTGTNAPPGPVASNVVISGVSVGAVLSCGSAVDGSFSSFSESSAAQSMPSASRIVQAI